MNPELKFYEGAKAFCALARRRAKDPREGKAAADLEIELTERIRRIEDAEKQAELELAPTGTGGGA